MSKEFYRFPAHESEVHDTVALVTEVEKLSNELIEILNNAAMTAEYPMRCPAYIGGRVYDLIERAWAMQQQALREGA